MNIVTEKYCHRCGKSEGEVEFSKGQRWCKQCNSEYAHSYQQRARLRWRADSDYRAKKLRQAGDWRRTHKEELGAYYRAYDIARAEERANYRQGYKERANELRRQRHKRNPNYNRIVCGRRRSRLHGCNGTHTVEEWENLLVQYGHRCLACNTRDNLTQDHIMPLSKGGSDNIENIQPLCQSCNSKKKDRYIDYRTRCYNA